MTYFFEKVDPELEVNIKEATKLIAEMSQDKLRFTYRLQKRTDDAYALEKWLRYLNTQKDCLKSLLIKERKKMYLLQLLLDKLRCADNAYQTKSIKECLSAQEMNRHKLHCQMVHGSKSLTKEKQLLRDMKLSQQEDEFVTFWTQSEQELRVCFPQYLARSKVWRFDPVKQILLLFDLMPFFINKRDAAKEHILKQFSDFEFRKMKLWNCTLKEYNDYEAIANNNENWFSAWKGKTSSSLGLKKALQEQVKVAAKKIEELRKTRVALGLGKIIGQVEIELKAMKRGIDSWRKRFPKRKDTAYVNRLNPSNAKLRSMRLEVLSVHYY